MYFLQKLLCCLYYYRLSSLGTGTVVWSASHLRILPVMSTQQILVEWKCFENSACFTLEAQRSLFAEHIQFYVQNSKTRSSTIRPTQGERKTAEAPQGRFCLGFGMRGAWTSTSPKILLLFIPEERKCRISVIFLLSSTFLPQMLWLKKNIQFSLDCLYLKTHT